jgi:hypothetical protein
MATFFLHPAARENNRQMTRILIVAAIALAIPSVAASADDGLITKPSRHSVEETIENLEAAVNAHAAAGWVVFGRIDHAAAAKKAGLDMRPRTVIIFGNPKSGHARNDEERNTGDRSANEGACLAGRPGPGLAHI